MTKRLVDIDDTLLTEALALSGATMKDTVELALRQLVEAESRRRHLVRLESGVGLDLADEVVMQGAWR